MVIDTPISGPWQRISEAEPCSMLASHQVIFCHFQGGNLEKNRPRWTLVLKKTRWSDDPSDFQLVLEGCFVIPAVDEFKIAGRAWMCLLHSYFVAGLPSFLSLLQAWGETHHLQLGGCPRYSKSIIAIWKTHHESIMKVDHLERGTNRFTYIYIHITYIYIHTYIYIYIYSIYIYTWL